MQVSLSTASLYIYPLRKVFQLAKRTGFDGVELVISPEVEWRGPDYVQRLADEFDLPILTVHPPLFAFPGWRNIHTSVAPYFDKALALTRALGSPLLVLHTPRALRFDDPIGREYVDKIVGARRSLNGSGPRLALENSSRVRERAPNYILSNLKELRAFSDEHDFPMTLDTAHVATWGTDLLRSIDYFDGRLANVHLSDMRHVPDWTLRVPRIQSYIRTHQMPGEGDLPLHEFIRELGRRGYSGPITYELGPFPLRLWSPRLAEQKLRECVEFVREAE